MQWHETYSLSFPIFQKLWNNFLDIWIETHLHSCFFLHIFSTVHSRSLSLHWFIHLHSVCKLLECRLLVHRAITLGSLWPRPNENNSRCWFSHVTQAASTLFTYHFCPSDVQYKLSKTRVLLFHRHIHFFILFLFLRIDTEGSQILLYILSIAFHLPDLCEPLSFIALENKVVNTAVKSFIGVLMIIDFLSVVV